MSTKIDLSKITHTLLFLSVLFLPLKTTLSNFFVLLLFAACVVSIVLHGLNTALFKERKFYLATTLLLYAPFVIGFLYAPVKTSAFDELERMIFYLLAPMILLRQDLSRQEVLKTATWALLIGSMLCMLYLHGYNLYRYFFVEDQNGGLLSYYYTGNSFVAPLIDMHPVYIGSYLLMLVVLLGERIIALKRIILLIVCSLLVLTILFLSSRIVFLGGVIWLAFIFFKRMSAKTRIISVLVLLLGSVLFITKGRETYVYNKLVKGAIWELGNNPNSSNIDSKKKSDSRMARWTASTEMIMDRPLFGHGTGTEQRKLIEVYSMSEMLISKEKQYNAHNQFLGYAIQFGLVGLLMLISYFWINLKWALKEPNIPLLGFCIIVFCCCLTENYLIRNMGVNFVALFGTILHLKKMVND